MRVAGMHEIRVAQAIIREHGFDHVDRKDVVAAFRQRRRYCRQEVVRSVDVDALVDHRHYEDGSRTLGPELSVVVSWRRACAAAEERDETQEGNFARDAHGVLPEVAVLATGADATLIMRSMKTFDSGQ